MNTDFLDGLPSKAYFETMFLCAQMVIDLVWAHGDSERAHRTETGEIIWPRLSALDQAVVRAVGMLVNSGVMSAPALSPYRADRIWGEGVGIARSMTALLDISELLLDVVLYDDDPGRPAAFYLRQIGSEFYAAIFNWLDVECRENKTESEADAVMREAQTLWKEINER